MGNQLGMHRLFLSHAMIHVAGMGNDTLAALWGAGLLGLPTVLELDTVKKIIAEETYLKV